jgi:hypothetical protein
VQTDTLEVQARDHRNEPATLGFQLTPVPEAGPRLRWCKERLVSLVAKDDKAGAIRLSCDSNLLCPYTAFVAWDEQERVAVAEHRLVQPALVSASHRTAAVGSRGMRYCLVPPSAPVERDECSSLYEEFFGDQSSFSDFACKAVHERLTLEERVEKLLKEVGEFPHCQAVLTLLQSLVAWVAAGLDTRSEEELTEFLNEMEVQLRDWRWWALRLCMLGNRMKGGPERPGARQKFDQMVAELERQSSDMVVQIESFIRQHCPPASQASGAGASGC